MPSPEGSPRVFGPNFVQRATEDRAETEATAAGTSGCSAAAGGTGSFEAFQAAIAAMQQAVLQQRQGAQPQPAGSAGLVPGALGQINGEFTPEQQPAAAAADRATQEMIEEARRRLQGHPGTSGASSMLRSSFAAPGGFGVVPEAATGTGVPPGGLGQGLGLGLAGGMGMIPPHFPSQPEARPPATQQPGRQQRHHYQQRPDPPHAEPPWPQPPAVVDTRALGKPQSYDGSEALWKEWRFTFTAYAGCVAFELRELMERAASQSEPINTLALNLRQRQLGETLFYMLALTLKQRALRLRPGLCCTNLLSSQALWRMAHAPSKSSVAGSCPYIAFALASSVRDCANTDW